MTANIIVRIGPEEYPQDQEMQFIEPADMPGFYRCRDVTGQVLLVHRNKIKVKSEKAKGKTGVAL